MTELELLAKATHVFMYGKWFAVVAGSFKRDPELDWAVSWQDMMGKRLYFSLRYIQGVATDGNEDAK